MNTELRYQVKTLLLETGKAHHEAFKATDGADPDWPIWYADYLRDRFAKLFGMEFSRSQLIYCLMNANFEHEARGDGREWAEFYANEFVEHFAPAWAPAEDSLALYYFEGCPYCAMVRTAIAELGVDVELRNIFEDPDYRADLVAARGRATVPVLRITATNGEERWMPESRDIVRDLEDTYG